MLEEILEAIRFMTLAFILTEAINLADLTPEDLFACLAISIGFNVCAIYGVCVIRRQRRKLEKGVMSFRR
jgi:hypothetical protein